MNLWHNLRGHLLDPSTNIQQNEELRGIAKWTLELVRNLVAVAGLQVLAQISQSRLLQAVAFIAYVALYVYCVSYFRWFVPHVFPSIKNQNKRALVILAIVVVVGFCGIGLISFSLNTAIDEIVRVQKPSVVLPAAFRVDE
jgi:hypothetical protein